MPQKRNAKAKSLYLFPIDLARLELVREKMTEEAKKDGRPVPSDGDVVRRALVFAVKEYDVEDNAVEAKEAEIQKTL